MTLEEYFSNFFDPLPVAIILTSMDGNVILKNSYVREATVPLHRGETIFDYVLEPPDKVSAYLKIAAASRSPLPGSLTFRYPKGQYLKYKMCGYRVTVPGSGKPGVLLKGRPIKETQGEFSILNRELAIEKQALKNLKVSHEILKSVLNSLEAIVYVADMETHEIIFINDYCKRLLGDITGKICWQTLQSGQSGPCPFCTNKYLLKEDGQPGAPYFWEFQNTVNGRWYYIIDRAIRWVDGRIVRLEVATDITQKKEMELAIKEAKEQWEHTFNAIDLSIAILDTQKRIKMANKGAERLFDASSKEILGKRCQELFAPKGIKCHSCPAEDAFIEKRPIRRQVTSEDGRTIFDIHISPILDEEGQVKGIVHIAEDITEKKIIERKLQHSQKLEAIGTLAGGIAHDFNNILMPILGYTEISLNMVSPEEKLASNLQMIRNSALRAKELIQQILTFSRAQEQERKPTYPQQVIKETLKMIRSILPKNIDIEQDISTDCSQILATPTHLQQILMNLCTNAYQAIQPNGGVLAIKLKEVEMTENDPKVAAGELASGGYVMLEVSDTGCGMDQETMQKIFEPYFTTRASEGGTGLGLAMVMGIIKGYGGTVTVYSEPGKGSTFRCYIPVHNEEREPSPKQNDEAYPLATGKAQRLLIVDDEGAILEMLKEGLTGLGYQVTAFSTPDGALSRFREAPHLFDLVITDLSMPKMTGLELIKEIHATRSDIPVILCTGFSELINKESIEGLRIDAYLQKPVTAFQMARTISHLLNKG